MKRPNLFTGVSRDVLYVGLFGVLGQALVFVLHVLLARRLGVVEYGVFAVVLAWVNSLLVVATVGQERAAMRFVPVLVDDPVALYRYYNFGFKIVAGTSIVIAAVLLFAGEPLLVRSGDPQAVLAGAVFLLGNGVFLYRLGVVRGLRQPVLPQFLGTVARPLMVGATFFLLLSLGVTANATAALASFAVAAWVLQWCVLGRLPRRPQAVSRSASKPDSPRADWVRTGLTMSLCGGALVLMYSVDIIMLNWLRDAGEAGSYSVMSRLSVLVIFGMNCAQIVVSPILARAYADKRMDRVRDFAALAALMSAVFGLTIGVLLVVFGRVAIGFFGEEYLVGIVALRILILGQLLNVLTGITGSFMNMVGEPIKLLRYVLIGLCANVILNFILIPHYGDVGAAIAAVISHFLWNVIAYLHVRRQYGIDLSIVTGVQVGMRYLTARGT